MNQIKINYIAPSGSELPNQSSKKFIDRLNAEIALFNTSINSKDVEVEHIIKVVEDGNAGLPELVEWGIKLYQHHENEIKMTISFISNLKLIVKMFWNPVGKKSNANRVDISYKGRTISLPTTDEKFNEFIDLLKK